MNEKNHHKYDMLLDPPGESRWATPDEIKRSSSHVDLDADSYPVGGLPVLVDGNSAYVDGSDAHTLIFGTTGSKKTRLFCMPLVNILIKAGESFLVADPKGEIYDRTSGLAQKNGYDIKVINLRDIGKGDMWNPISQPAKFLKSGDPELMRQGSSMINDIAAFLVSRDAGRSRLDPFWTETGRSYLVGTMRYLIAAAAPDEVNMTSVSHLCIEENAAYLKYLSRMMEDTCIIKYMLNLVFSSAKDTLRSILISAFSYITSFTSDEWLAAMLAQNTVDMEQLGLKKTACYLIIPDEKTTYHFLAAMFIKQQYECLISVAQKRPDNKLPVRVNFVLDEFCNFPEIPQMANMISAGRSRNIRFFLVAQSLRQLLRKYDSDAYTILGNCENIVFLTSREIDLLNTMQALCGKKSQNARNLISVSELQRLSKERGEALLMIKRNYPFISSMPDIDDYSCFERCKPAPMAENNTSEYGTFAIRKLARRVLDGEKPPFSKYKFSVNEAEAEGDSGLSADISRKLKIHDPFDDKDIQADLRNSPPDDWMDAFNKLDFVYKKHGKDPERS